MVVWSCGRVVVRPCGRACACGARVRLRALSRWSCGRVVVRARRFETPRMPRDRARAALRKSFSRKFANFRGLLDMGRLAEAKRRGFCEQKGRFEGSLRNGMSNKRFFYANSGRNFRSGRKFGPKLLLGRKCGPKLSVGAQMRAEAFAWGVLFRGVPTSLGYE